MWRETWDFAVAILWNHFTLSGGCVLTVLVGLYEKYWKTASVSMATYSRVILVLFVFACFQAWQGERESKVGRERDLNKQELANIGQKRLTTLETENRIRKEIEKDHCDSLLQASQRNINDYGHLVLAQQSVDQGKQRQTAACLLDLAEARKPVPRRMRQIGLWYNSHVSPKSTIWLLVTNKSVTPLSVTVSCHAERPISITNFQAVVVGDVESLNLSNPALKVAENTWTVTIGSPAWTEDSPVLANVVYNGEPDKIICQFSTQ